MYNDVVLNIFSNSKNFGNLKNASIVGIAKHKDFGDIVLE